MFTGAQSFITAGEYLKLAYCPLNKTYKLINHCPTVKKRCRLIIRPLLIIIMLHKFGKDNQLLGFFKKRQPAELKHEAYSWMH